MSQSANNQQGIVQFKPGDFVLREKTKPTALYIIKEGQLEVYKTGKDGNKISIAIINSGEYVGETAILLDHLNMSNVVALTPVKAVRLDREKVEKQLKQAPGWLVALTKGLVARLHKTNDLLKKHGLIDEQLSTQIQAFEARKDKKDAA